MFGLLHAGRARGIPTSGPRARKGGSGFTGFWLSAFRVSRLQGSGVQGLLEEGGTRVPGSSGLQDRGSVMLEVSLGVSFC